MENGIKADAVEVKLRSEATKDVAGNDASTRLLEETQKEPAARGQNPIDQLENACKVLARSASESVKCNRDAQTAWNSVMDEAYKALQKQSLQVPGQNQDLIDAQKQWIKFRKSELASIQRIFWGHPEIETDESRQLVKDRAVELQNRAGDNTNGSCADRVNEPYEEPEDGVIRLDTLEDADSAVRGNYRQLKSILSPFGQSYLRQSQEEWGRFRDAEFDLIDGSRSTHNEKLTAKIDLVKNRAVSLRQQYMIRGELSEGPH